jgi:hypothetical protein
MIPLRRAGVTVKIKADSVQAPVRKPTAVKATCALPVREPLTTGTIAAFKRFALILNRWMILAHIVPFSPFGWRTIRTPCGIDIRPANAGKGRIPDNEGFTFPFSFPLLDKFVNLIRCVHASPPKEEPPEQF